MTIGEVAWATGISAKMIRYYESISLMPAVLRSESGYRIYSPSDVHTLRFIKRARTLGFSINQIEEFLTLWRDRRRTSGHVKAVARAHIDELKVRISEMQGMVDTLEHLVEHCRGDHRPECPIIDDIARKLPAPTVSLRTK